LAKTNRGSRKQRTSDHTKAFAKKRCLGSHIVEQSVRTGETLFLTVFDRIKKNHSLYFAPGRMKKKKTVSKPKELCPQCEQPFDGDKYMLVGSKGWVCKTCFWENKIRV
jgi:hypothetical protein